MSEPNETWATDELIAFALMDADPDETDRWAAISVLRRRGTREVFDAAARLCGSGCPVERRLGVNVHAQLGYEQDKPFADESTALLIRLLEAEDDPDVIHAALTGFGHLQRPDSVPAAVRFANHPSERVRFGVAFALCGADDDRAVRVLLELTRDRDPLVRDWATTGIAGLPGRDTPEIRAALWARTDDEDSITRGEALKGLAARRDPRTAGAITAELGRLDASEYAVEAAEELADPRLVPALEALRERWGESEWLTDVIARCRAGERGA